jgi:hypothetical protein
MSKLFEHEHLVKAWDGCSQSKSIAKKHYTLSLSGKFFVATKTGTWVDNTGNLKQATNEDIAQGVDKLIIAKGWHELAVATIADLVSQRLHDMGASGEFDFTQLEIKLIEKFTGAENGLEEVHVLERPVMRKMPSLTHYE